MAQGAPQGITSLTGRRGYYRYAYGLHGWVPVTDADWSRGIVRDAPRVAIPANGVYDAADFLLHQVGIAIKRGGTSYAGPVMGTTTSAKAVAYAEFPAGAQIVGVGSDNGLYKITSGTTTSLGGSTVSGGIIDTPKLRVGGGKNLLVFPCADGTTAPIYWDGSAAPAGLGGSPPAGKVCEIYKTRLVLAGKSGNENRLYFSPTPDITSTWDTTDSWIDCDHAVSGLAALHNALIIFSQGHCERIIGTTPPPGSDMDRAPLGDVGCTDARSIVVQEGNAIFANPRGVWLTNGAGFASLTTEGLIETYWQSLLQGYDPATWTIAAGILRSFYFVTITDNNGSNVVTLMCNVPKRAWWRLTNIQATMYAQGVGKQDELYYADKSHGRVVQMSGIFMPSASNKNDADGTAVAPMLETRARGGGPDLKSFGDGELNYDMRDAASDNPTLAVQISPGFEAASYTAVTESPLAETTADKRARFSTGIDSAALSVKLQQTNASSKTEIYALEVSQRSYPSPMEGQ